MSVPARSRASNIGSYGLIFDHDDVVQLLRAAVEREENQVAYAKRHGIDLAAERFGSTAITNNVSTFRFLKTKKLAASQQESWEAAMLSLPQPIRAAAF